MRNATEYILMNKDVPYALFSCAQDEFGEESAILREWYTDLRSIGLQSLTAWLEKRRAPKRRNGAASRAVRLCRSGGLSACDACAVGDVK